MDKKALFEQIQRKKSFLCIGLDTDLAKIPAHLLKESDPVYSFNKAIVDATAEFAVSYKPNTAFYEANGSAGWSSLEKTVAYIRNTYPEIFIIIDAKRGDIGNTSANYARAFFDQMQADALTVAPYMGFDSVKPFLDFEGKWVVLLALTSNLGSGDFQYLKQTNGNPLFSVVLEKASKWADSEQMMFVVGATHPDELAAIRNMLPDSFFLVPGVGAQGGDLTAVAKAGLNQQCGLLVNSSRGIIYAKSDENFAEAARHEARILQKKMQLLLQENKLIQ